MLFESEEHLAMGSNELSTEQQSFSQLITHIELAHNELSQHASRAVNISLTLRNWLIGYYIAEYELNGSDKANYGDRLLFELAQALKKLEISSAGRRQLYNYLSFYRAYPQIVRSVTAKFKNLLPSNSEAKVRTASAQLENLSEKLVSSISYSHFELLIGIEDELKRRFYELETIKGNWSVRELKRQINSLYYERSGLSKDKIKLADLAHKNSEQQTPALVLRDPYIFEFLGLKPEQVMSESHLEAQLIHKLEDFLLELGHGFCFEARQKRILIGGEHFFVDLVFYHRVLKCHILVELKLEQFSHENIGQLNTYVSWYRKNMMTEGDNPPIGILLCTDKNNALVEYALAGMDSQLFVSKYQLELPNKDDMQKFIEQQLQEPLHEDSI